MAGDDDLLHDSDQHEIAETILLHTVRLALHHPKAMNCETVASMLAEACAERDRQGDYVAAGLLEVWSNLMRAPLGDPK